MKQITKKAMSKAEIKRKIKDLRGEYGAIADMIDASGGHGWGDEIDSCHDDMEVIIDKIDELKKQL
jgi:uncharacterized coiled-coil DUF342 family protein